MDDLNRTKRITIAAILFTAVLAISFLTYKRPLVDYELSPVQMNYKLTSVEQVSPGDALTYLNETSAEFVDIRDIYDYERDHLESAINIPVPDLLDKQNVDLFNNWKNDSRLVIFYGNNEVEANASWMMMYQLGYTNTRVLLGGFEYLKKLENGTLSENESYSVEKPAYDFEEVFKEISGDNGQIQTNQLKQEDLILRKKTKKKAEGGC